jgi:hypothetical protein
MRTANEIRKDFNEHDSNKDSTAYATSRLMIELLIDIRDILNTIKKRGSDD